MACREQDILTESTGSVLAGTWFTSVAHIKIKETGASKLNWLSWLGLSCFPVIAAVV